MLKITLKVPPERDRAAWMEITDGLTTLIEDAAVATSVTGTVRSLRDHPPLGRYELTARGPTPGSAETEYGAELLLFEPIAGSALEAEAHGRLGLLVYAGSAGRDMSLRRTQGGVRLSRRAMEVLLQHIGDDTEVELDIESLSPPPWWAFWRKSRTPPSLSKDSPRLTAPPYDEASVAAQLLRGAIRRNRARRTEDRDDNDRWRDRDSSSNSSRDSGADFRGAGGSGGGGGASGGWTDAPTAGRGPGVNAAGIIVSAAGVAAVAAAAAAAAQRESASGTDIESQPSASWGDTPSSDTGGGASGTTTSTAY